MINIYVTYKLRKRTISSPHFTVKNALFGAVKLTKDVNTSHYGYSGYGICFDSGSSFSFGNSLTAKHVIIFVCDMSFSSHATNRNQKNIYIFGKDFVQGINGTTLYTEKLYNIDFTQPDRRFVLPLHYNSDDSYLFVNGVEQLKLKSAVTYLDRNLLTLSNIPADCSLQNMEKTGLHGNIYDCSIDYWPIDTGKIRDVHRYLMEKTILYKMFKLIKKSSDDSVNNNSKC